MSHLLIAVVSCLCIVIVAILLWCARESFAETKTSFRRIRKLEEALANPDVVDIVQRMAREPWVENPSSFLEKRRNKRYALLVIRLRSIVEDEETRKLIYRFIKTRIKR